MSTTESTTDEPITDVVDEQDGATADGADQAPARPARRTRRKVTARATTPAPAPTAEQPTVADAAPEEDPGTTDRAEPAAVVGDPGTQDPETAREEPDDPDQESDGTRQEPGDPDQDDPDDEAHLPAASLLFQAPDPARARRRRRVSSPATTPVATPAVQGDDAGEDADADDGSEASTSRSSRGRRRTAQSEGGEPRRSRKRQRATGAGPEEAEAGTKTEAEAAETPGATGAQAPAVDTDEQDAEGSESSHNQRKRRRGGRGRRSRTRSDEAVQDTSDGEHNGSDQDEDAEEPAAATAPDSARDQDDEEVSGSSRRRRRRRPRSRSDEDGRDVRDEVTALKGSTRLEAKRQRRREGRAAGRRRPVVTEAEFLARRESVDRQMVVRERDGLNQIAVLEDGLLVEHYVARHTQASMVGNVYIGRVQNVLPSMEAAFVDLGKGRNAVLYAGEVNWDAAGMEGRPRRIENALKSGDSVLVQVTKDPIGHKGARLTSQVTLAGRFLVLVPGGSMTGISRKLPENERARLKKILKKVVPDSAGVIVRTAAEGASEAQLAADVERLAAKWAQIEKKAASVQKGTGKPPVLLKGEPELAVRVVRDVFNEDFRKLVVSGPEAWQTISGYVTELSPDLADRLEHWTSTEDVFAAHRIDEQLAKGFDRKVWLPSGGTLVIDRTEAMTVIDVNTGRFTGAGGTLEETITRNNIEAAEEIVRQLRLRDIGGMVVIDFVDMVLESNRDLVLRRLVECLGRDRTRHQVTEVTSLGLVQMTRKRVGQGLVEAFSTPCECCNGRGFVVHDTPVENQQADVSASSGSGQGGSRRRGRKGKDDAAASSGHGSGRSGAEQPQPGAEDEPGRAAVRSTLAQIAAAAEQAHKEREPGTEESADAVEQPAQTPAEVTAEASAPESTEPAQPARPRRRRRAVSTGVVNPEQV